MLFRFKYLLPFLLIFKVGFSQSLKKETLTNQGSTHFVYANNKSYFIQESIGQASVIKTFDSGNYSIRQGFLQPIDASLLNSDEVTSLDAIIFPNPFAQDITIQFNEPIFDVLRVNITDVSGRVILSKSYNPTYSLTITLFDLTNGIYLMTVQMRQKELVAKLIKQ